MKATEIANELAQGAYYLRSGLTLERVVCEYEAWVEHVVARMEFEGERDVCTRLRETWYRGDEAVLVSPADLTALYRALCALTEGRATGGVTGGVTGGAP